MPIYDKTELSRRAKELSVVRDTLEKVLRLCEILRFFDSSPLFKDHLALKGGTAINLLFFNLPRLSVDIDLDFCVNMSKDEMDTTREIIRDKLLKYMVASGYSQSSKSKIFHSLHSYVFEYTNSGGMRDNIKIEINYSLRSHVLPIKKIRMPSDIVEGGFEVNTVSPVEIYAAKTVALLTRGAARDLYDMNYMVNYRLFSDEELELYRQCVVFYLAVATEFPIMEIDYRAMEMITPHKITTDLKPVVRDRDVFELDRAKETVMIFLDENLYLTKEDIVFLKWFGKGLYRPELIFKGEMLKNVENHPMAIWKTQNNREKIRSNDRDER